MLNPIIPKVGNYEQVPGVSDCKHEIIIAKHPVSK